MVIVSCKQAEKIYNKATKNGENLEIYNNDFSQCQDENVIQ